MYKYILFDLDGTLTDSKEGLFKSFQYALSHFGITEENENNLKRMIGPPAHHAFCEFYGFSEEDAIKSTVIFRERFEKKGIYENKLFPGVSDMLKELKDEGMVLAIATSKPKPHALTVLEYFNISKFFDYVAAPPTNNKDHTKAMLINSVLEKLGAEKSEAVMVGDRKFDILAAKESGIKSIGVSFGYASSGELQECNPDYIVNSIEELKNILKKDYSKE